MKAKTNRQSGFTIIEVVLVLAIAGLIFLVVFLALPQLQRSQRDSARQSDVGRLISAITTYTSNESNGIPPNTPATVQTAVIDQNYIDDFNYTMDTVANADTDTMGYVAGEDCDGNTNNRTFSVVVGQENGPDYCRAG